MISIVFFAINAEVPKFALDSRIIDIDFYGYYYTIGLHNVYAHITHHYVN